MLTLSRLDPERCDWQRVDALADRVLFQTREWLSFVTATQGGEPVIADVKDGNEHVGLFTGVVFRRYGIRILGSPFPGWTTPSMGFNLAPSASHHAAVEALVPFAFHDLGCLHLELKDRRLSASDMEGLQFDEIPEVLFEIDLTLDEAELFGNMSSACRRCVRKSEKEGVVVEVADDLGFADDYYAQLEDVFAKQSLRPTYDVERVRALIRHVLPTGNLLLLRARAPDGTCIATGIFPAFNGVMYFWGGASWREHQILRPNEAIFWHAVRYWKARGMSAFDMGGGGDYKRKYGPTEHAVSRFTRSRFAGLSTMRRAAKQLHDADLVWKARRRIDAVRGRG